MKPNHRLREARFYRHLSQADIWLKTGIHFSTLSRFETGHLVPSAKQKRKLARALRVPRGWLFADEAERGGKAPGPRERLPWEESKAGSSSDQGKAEA